MDSDTYYTSGYCNPYYINSIVTGEGYSRMAMTEESDISEGEMIKVIGELRTKKLYFVVPNKIFNNFRR